jgi:hypothetical protein
MKQHFFVIIAVILFSLLSVRSLFSSGFFPMHDDTQVARVVEMGKALRWGQFPVRWVSDLGYGYGYPIFNFYGPLPYYAGGFFSAIGIPGLLATKIMIILGVLLGAIFMYCLSSRFFGKIAGVLSSVSFVFAIYRAVQLYVRGSIGEYWAISFFPLALLGILLAFQKQNKSSLILGLGLMGIILSHTLYGYVVTFLGAIVLVILFVRSVQTKNYKTFRFVMVGYCLGFALTAFFWLPAFAEMKYTNVAAQVSSTADFHDHFVCLAQLIGSTWGYGGSVAGCHDGLSFSLGKLLLLSACIGFAVGVLKKSTRFFSIIGGIITVVSLFFLLSVSKHVWEYIPYMQYLQYPWRYLGLVIVGLSFLSGISVFVIPSKIGKLVFAGVFVVLTFLLNGRYFEPQYLYAKTEADFESPKEISFRVSQISDEYLPKEIVKPLSEAELPHDTIVTPSSVEIKTVINQDIYKKYELITPENTSVKVNIAAFPGWRYIVNGQKATVAIDHGLPIIQIPKGFSTMELSFANTPVRTLGNCISIIAFAAVIIIYGKKTIT